VTGCTGAAVVVTGCTGAAVVATGCTGAAVVAPGCTGPAFFVSAGVVVDASSALTPVRVEVAFARIRLADPTLKIAVLSVILFC
jgi:hypothetical protein